MNNDTDSANMSAVIELKLIKIEPQSCFTDETEIVS